VEDAEVVHRLGMAQRRRPRVALQAKGRYGSGSHAQPNVRHNEVPAQQPMTALH
jgi:hypothetical protein